MKGEKKQEWIEQGYRIVAESGFDALSIESLARAINKSKSSFYHYFGDIDLFKLELLDYHEQCAMESAKKIMACDSMRPGLVNVFLTHQTDILFHKQLRINRADADCKKCFEKVFENYELALIDKWVTYFGLSQKRMFAATFLRFIAEHFLLKITPATYSRDWLNNYLEEVDDMLKQMNAGN